MPELPEVEVVRQGLAPRLMGRRIVAARHPGRSLRLPLAMDEVRRWVPGAEVRELRRRGKYLLVALDNGARLVFHLGMTGRLGLFPAAAPLAPHDHLCFALDDGLELRFNDTRRFGSLQLLGPGEDEGRLFAALGPEPLGEAFTPDYLAARSAGRRQPVKVFLMDGRVVVGIGNIYASEILFAAALSPLRAVGQVTMVEWRRVVDSTGLVLRRAIAAGGSTIADFVNASGRPGYFQLELKVYGRAGQACPRCGGGIDKQVLAGRASYFCRGCQP